MSLNLEAHRLNLDIHQNVYVAFVSKQFNSDEKVIATLFNKGQLVDIGNDSISLKVATPDNCFYEFLASSYWYRCGNCDNNAKLVSSLSTTQKAEVKNLYPDIKDTDYVCLGTDIVSKYSANEVAIHFPQKVFKTYGRANAELILTNGNTVSTMPFSFRIVPSVYDSDKVFETAYPTDKVEQIKEYVDNALRLTGENVEATNADVITTNANVAITLSYMNATEEYKNTAESRVDEIQGYATSANESANEARTFSNNANNRASAAKKSADSAQGYKDEALNFATVSKSYAIGGTSTREGEDINNAKYWAEQAMQATASITGSLRPMGTRKYEELPVITISEITHLPDQVGFIYNISDDFISDDRFEDGGYKKYNAGSNVYCTANGKWDVLASNDDAITDAYINNLFND